MDEFIPISKRPKTVSDFIQSLKQDKTRPLPRKQRKEYLAFLNSVNVASYVKNEMQIDHKVEELLKSANVKSANVLQWNILYPFDKYFGFTGPHLSFLEIIHFQAVESIFRSTLNHIPKDWTIFKEKKVIGATSVSGIVLEVGPPKFPSMFIVKSPRSRTSLELNHEFLIGKVVCNDMRSHILPNFPYHFGLLNCSYAKVKKGDKQIVDWCTPTDKVPQILLENVRDSYTLYDAVQKEPTNLIFYLLQTMNAVFAAFQKYGFSHNDLHTDNVLIRSLPKSSTKIVDPWLLPIVFDFGYFVLKPGTNDKVAVMIDYGQSSITLNGAFIAVPQDPTTYHPESAGVSRPVNDIIHLMAFLLDNILKFRLKINNDGYAEDVVATLESMYSEFRNLIKTKIPKTLTRFIETTSSESIWYNLDPSTKTIENSQFIKTWFLNVLKLPKVKTFYQSHFVRNPNNDVPS